MSPSGHQIVIEDSKIREADLNKMRRARKNRIQICFIPTDHTPLKSSSISYKHQINEYQVESVCYIMWSSIINTSKAFSFGERANCWRKAQR